MNWQLKCAAFHVLAHVPAGRSVYKFLQHYVTRRSRFKVTDEQLQRYAQHVLVYSELAHPGTTLEFGAGRNLFTPLLLSAAGAKAVYAFDIERLATVEAVNHTIRQLRGRVPGDWP